MERKTHLADLLTCNNNFSDIMKMMIKSISSIGDSGLVYYTVPQVKKKSDGTLLKTIEVTY